ncbi:MAG: hypothetical protein RBT34_00160, partial [Anaerolineaceae bacterium]|nr:hypothetical protein [Anaerolineaceae bacterium]
MSSVTKTLRINTSHMLVRELADTLLRHPNLPLDDLINGLWNGLQGIIDHVETGMVDNHEITSTRFIMIDCPNWDMNLLTQQLHVVISDLSQQNDLSTRQARLQRACEIILESITANKPCDLSPLGNATSVEYHLLKCVKYRVVKSVPGKDYMPDDDDWEYVDGP